MEAKAIIETQDLTKIYNGEAAVDQLSFQLREGEVFGFLGPNGAGKTTTLMMLAGFETPTHGEIFIGDRSIGNIPPHKRGIGIVFQDYALFPHMTSSRAIMLFRMLLFINV